MFDFYQVDPQVDWHHDGRLQFIHGLRNFAQDQVLTNHQTCLSVRSAIARAGHHALAQYRVGDEAAGLYWSGHGLHILQDSYSPAHVVRDGAYGERVQEFCTYSVQLPGICFHTKLDARDRIWRGDRLDCALNPGARSWDCLTESAQNAADASFEFLAAIQRSRMEGGSTDQALEAGLSRFLPCEDIANQAQL